MSEIKNQWMIHNIYSGRARNFNVDNSKQVLQASGEKTKKSLKCANSRLTNIMMGGLLVLICILTIFAIVKAVSID